MCGEKVGLQASGAEADALVGAAGLSFEEFNQRIEALPDGPIKVLNAPRWQRWFDRLGMVPLLLFGVLWALLTLGWLAPAAWMVPAAKYLVVGMAVLWLPGVLRSVWLIVQEVRKGTAGFMRQWDHDLVMLEGVQQWLAQYPRTHLEQRLLQCRQLQDGLQRKLGIFLGGAERWGMLPMLVAVFYLLQQREKLLELPTWLMLVGISIVVFWVIALSAWRARLRLALMEDLLHGVLQKSPP